MYSKSVTYKFTSFTSAKIAAGHCTEYLSRHVVKLEMSSLTITVSKESEVSISANFDDIGNLKKFDGLISSLVSELRDAFDFKENNKSSVCVFNYQKETVVDSFVRFNFFHPLLCSSYSQVSLYSVFRMYSRIMLTLLSGNIHTRRF